MEVALPSDAVAPTIYRDNLDSDVASGGLLSISIALNCFPLANHCLCFVQVQIEFRLELFNNWENGGQKSVV